MKAAQHITSATPAKKNVSFFNKENRQDFFHAPLNQISFFSKQKNNSLYQGVGASGTGNELAPTSKTGECTPGRSESNCFDGAGYIITKIDNDCCTRPCTVEHESIHVRDLNQCCKAFHRARKADGADAAAVTATYQNWLNVARKVSECRAYSNDITCAKRLAVEKGCVPGKDRNQKSTEVAVNADDGSGISESVSNEVSKEATAQDGDLSAPVSGGIKEQSGCCNDIVSYSEMFAPEARAWCGEAAGRSIPPCPFTSRP